MFESDTMEVGRISFLRFLHLRCTHFIRDVARSDITRMMLFFMLSWASCNVAAQWTSDLPTIGTFSSIRVTDLNSDGTADIVLGAGREEFHSCDSAVVALDGVTGDVLWTVSAEDQIFGSAIFQDLDGDGTDDVLIGGRSASLMAISGVNGRVLWRFKEANNDVLIGGIAWYNFYNPQWIPDQNDDGLREILITNGGDVLAAPHDPDRPPGRIVVINAGSGKIIQSIDLPDGGETYMSPSVSWLKGKDDMEVVFGTGGETIGGSLYVDLLSNILKGSLDDAIALCHSEHKGFVGPAVRVDLNDDDILDIVANEVDGRVVAFDGASHTPLWIVTLPGAESYSIPCIGYFNDDAIPDIFVTYGQGTWPHLDWSVQRMINGASGEILFSDSLGYYQNTSPLAIDLNGDGLDEVVMSLNFQEVDSLYRKFFYTTLVAKEFVSGDLVQIAPTSEGSNLSSTPWMGDLDGDGLLDIIYCHGTNLRHTYTFDGITVHRLETQVEVPAHFWGAYQGNTYTGTFR